MRGYFGIGVLHPKTEHNIGTLWRSAYAMGADFIFTVGRRYRPQSSDTTKATVHIPLWHFNDLDDLREHLPSGCPIVGIELAERSLKLPDYQHPLRAAYLLGAEDHGLTPDATASCHEIVEIPLAKYCLNVAVAGSIVIYDRVLKASQKKEASTVAAEA